MKKCHLNISVVQNKQDLSSDGQSFAKESKEKVKVHMNYHEMYLNNNINSCHYVSKMSSFIMLICKYLIILIDLETSKQHINIDFY